MLKKRLKKLYIKKEYIDYLFSLAGPNAFYVYVKLISTENSKFTTNLKELSSKLQLTKRKTKRALFRLVKLGYVKVGVRNNELTVKLQSFKVLSFKKLLRYLIWLFNRRLITSKTNINFQSIFDLTLKEIVMKQSDYMFGPIMLRNLRILCLDKMKDKCIIILNKERRLTRDDIKIFRGKSKAKIVYSRDFDVTFNKPTRAEKKIEDWNVSDFYDYMVKAFETKYKKRAPFIDNKFLIMSMKSAGIGLLRKLTRAPKEKAKIQYKEFIDWLIFESFIVPSSSNFVSRRTMELYLNDQIKKEVEKANANNIKSSNVNYSEEW